MLDAARASFAEYGLELPMEELARRAGVGVGTVYRHFPNKDALVEALLVDQLTERIQRTKAALEKDDPWEAFCDLVREGSEMNADDIASCDMLMDQKRASTSPVVIAMREELEAELKTLIERAQAAGKLRPDFTADDMPLVFVSIAGAIRAFGPDGPWRRQMEFALDGLRA